MQQNRTAVSCVSMIFAFFIPFVVFVIGWSAWNFKVGLVSSLAVFSVFLLIAGYSLATAKNLSWLGVFAPFISGVLYTIVPDFLPFLPFDDALVATAGALITFGLAIKKSSSLPKWLVLPLLLSGLYTLIGPIIPSTVDEFLVAVLGAAISASGIYINQQNMHKPSIASRQLPEQSEIIIDINSNELN